MAFFDRTAGDWIVWTGTKWITWSTPKGPRRAEEFDFYSLRHADESVACSSSQVPESTPETPAVPCPFVLDPPGSRKLTFKCDICEQHFREREVQPAKTLLTITEPDGTFRQFTDERTVCVPCVWKEFKVFPPLHKQ